MKIKTSELTDTALDWAVIVANGQNAAYWLEMYLTEGRRVFCARPSTEWLQGGPIVEREKIATVPLLECWEAQYENEQREDRNYIIFSGPTPLIAAMRCFVASKLGDEVDVPNELC